MILTFRSLYLFFCFLVVFFFIHPSYATATPTQLVNKVCNKTSNYTFCVEALYSDPQTAEADDYFLACISFRLAYLNATHTQHHISLLLKNATACPRHDSRLMLQRLQRCHRDYKKALFAIGQADNDLNSESFYHLPDYATDAARAADDCDAAFEGTPSPLTMMNRDLKGLSEICFVVSKLFNAS